MAPYNFLNDRSNLSKICSQENDVKSNEVSKWSTCLDIIPMAFTKQENH